MKEFYRRIGGKVGLMLAFLIGSSFPVNHDASATDIPNDTGVYLIIHFKPQSIHLEAFAEIMVGVEKAMASEPGFQTAQVYQGTQGELEFILIERWRSIALHREHYDRIVASGDWAHILTLLTEEPTMIYTRPFFK